jgi:3-oxoacyl-[acyl-carrier-protein] synthase-1
MLRKGVITDALVVGMELANRATLGGFAAMQLLSPSTCRPFAAERDGLVLGEAVAAVRLSTRDMGPWCMLGGANVVDGSQPTGASPDAVSAMFQRALADCGLDPQAIDLIKVQAAGSPGNDAAEAVGLQQAFSELPALVSLKAAMGHTMGASGAAEISLLTACVEHGEWPDVSTECDPSLGVSLAKQPPHDVRRVMATILGFGGSHATVVLERSGP